MHYRNLLAAAAVTALAFAGCRSYDKATAPNGSAATGTPSYGATEGPASALPLQQLAQAKAAAARYHDVRNAIADGYVDINLVIPNMGRHFLKEGLINNTFEADHPEALVYSSDSTNLLALEYLQPLSATPPEGFQGDADQWVPFGGLFWTLHAWVWKDNPDGLFNPTNSRVP